MARPGVSGPHLVYTVRGLRPDLVHSRGAAHDIQPTSIGQWDPPGEASPSSPAFFAYLLRLLPPPSSITFSSSSSPYHPLPWHAPPTEAGTIPRNLPHFDGALTTQTIAYRLGDGLPRAVALRRADETHPTKEPHYRRRIEAFLDAGSGCSCLTTPELATDIIDTWRHFDGDRYHLRAWVVMPNHVHVMITLINGHPLASIVQSWKSWTGKQIKAFTKTVSWQRDYLDRYIRDEAHYHQAVAYIHNNPVKAGLIADARRWPWSSAGEIS